MLRMRLAVLMLAGGLAAASGCCNFSSCGCHHHPLLDWFHKHKESDCCVTGAPCDGPMLDGPPGGCAAVPAAPIPVQPNLPITPVPRPVPGTGIAPPMPYPAQ
jgi:hypothetical protein